jgi:hypothetical protein
LIRVRLIRPILGLRASPLLGIIVLSGVVALACSAWMVTGRDATVGAAATHVLVDASSSWILDQRASTSDFESLAKRAELFAGLTASAPVRERIGRRIGVPGNGIGATTRLTGDVVAVMREPDSEQRAAQILASQARYRLDLQPDPTRPVLHIYAQAPSVARAEGLADATVAGLRDHLLDEAARAGIEPRHQARVDQLGPARGGVANPGARSQMAVLTFLVAFGACWAILLLARQARRGWHASGDRDGDPARRRGAARRAAPQASGDWPRTTRILPWSIAGFMVVLWLLPFNTTELAASLPFDLKLDRLVLPFVVAAWILAVIAGGSDAPRVRPTWIHGGIVAFVAVVCAGVVFDAHYLNQTLEFDTAVKKLTLLVSYLVLFVVIASAIRRGEVRAFLNYTLVLAVLCALGTIWEYRFGYNAFYDLTDKLLPALFQVGEAEAGLVDDQGRVLTRGPGEHPLEAVAMLSMALPIAIVGLLGSSRRRATVLYALAACVLLAAAISTYRKSALLAPLAVLLTIAWFRRGQVLRFAPLAAVSLLVVNAFSPGALSSILFQLQPDRLGVGTVSDRTSDYDAVRPDVWSHLLFGRGYGTYDHRSYRILDSEILSRLVDTGGLGLLSLVIMLATIVWSARGPIRSRHPVVAPPALAVAAASVAFLVLALLFDVSSFPHTPYILMSLAALLAVVIREPVQEEAKERPPPAPSALTTSLPRPTPSPVRERLAAYVAR